jgi:hypothetical protein
MSRKVLCPKCDEILSELANQFSELYESIEGESNGNYSCDDCGKSIVEGEVCFASVLLPNRSHPNYPLQKPSVWMGDYINPLK